MIDRTPRYQHLLGNLAYLVLASARYQRRGDHDVVELTLFDKQAGELTEYVVELWGELGGDRRIGVSVQVRAIARPR